MLRTHLSEHREGKIVFKISLKAIGTLGRWFFERKPKNSLPNPDSSFMSLGSPQTNT